MANISNVPVQLQGQQRPVVDIVWPPVRLEVYKDTPSAISVLSILDELRKFVVLISTLVLMIWIAGYISHANLSIPIGETAVSLKGSIELVRSAECALGNLLADILKQYNFGTHIGKFYAFTYVHGDERYLHITDIFCLSIWMACCMHSIHQWWCDSYWTEYSPKSPYCWRHISVGHIWAHLLQYRWVMFTSISFL